MFWLPITRIWQNLCTSMRRMFSLLMLLQTPKKKCSSASAAIARASTENFGMTTLAPKISERLKELQKKQNTQKRSERIHLDARMDEDSGDTFGKLLLVEQAKVTRVELFELISCAPKQARKVARMIVQKYTRSEIETMLQLSPGDYQRALLQLRTAWEEYNKEIF